MTTAAVREIKNSRASSEWFTPAKYVEAARLVMGGIELDPASCLEANQIVKADRYFTAAQDGRLCEWKAKSVWLNPPGGSEGESGTAAWSRYLIREYTLGHVDQAIMLVFNSSGTETKWFQRMLGQYPICLTNHRIKFIPPTGRYADPKKNQPVHGNAFVYFGKDSTRFVQVFRKFGKIIPAWERAS